MNRQTLAGLEELPAIDTNGVAVILINNEKGQITEDQIKEVFEEYDETARFAYYGEQVSKELFSEYRTKVKFTNNSSYIPDNLLATLKN